MSTARWHLKPLAGEMSFYGPAMQIKAHFPAVCVHSEEMEQLVDWNLKHWGELGCLSVCESIHSLFIKVIQSITESIISVRSFSEELQPSFWKSIQLWFGIKSSIIYRKLSISVLRELTLHCLYANNVFRDFCWRFLKNCIAENQVEEGTSSSRGPLFW